MDEQLLIGEIHSKEGIAGIHKAWQSGMDGNDGVTKDQLFRRQLKKQVGILTARLHVQSDHIPILISGMASSSIGMEDIPYARLPFALDGSQALIRRFGSQKDFPHEIILISGVKSQKDVMRGEETQLIGLLSLLESAGNKPEEAVLVFPGTHSKHIHVRNGQLVDFRSFMTGELFHLVSHHSILKDSIAVDDMTGFSEANKEAFRRGLKESGASSILNSLFTVRTNELFSKLGKIQNAYYLSGLLIGTEIHDLLNREACPLLLCSGQNLYDFYRLALEELDVLKRTSIVPVDIVERAAVAGQVLTYQHHILNETTK